MSHTGIPGVNAAFFKFRAKHAGFLMAFNITEFLLPIALYAETHFRFFSWMPSFLYKSVPEILFDCPRRINPHSELPVTLIFNDTFSQPISLCDISIAINQPGNKPVLFAFGDLSISEIDHDFKNNQKVYTILLKREKLPAGTVYLNCKATVRYRGKTFDILNDNLQTSSKLPLCCYISDTFPPGNQDCKYGDMHFHSQYSQSHVEFGPPLDVVDTTARASGLDFVAITDHSYDLCCSMKDYLTEEISLERWNSLQKQYEKKHEVQFLRGEEISCLNSNGNIIHLCGIGLKEYINGSSDGARRTKVFGADLSIDKVISRIQSQGGIAYAAHPGSKKALMQFLFLNRGTWTQKDIDNNPITGVQAFNGSYKGAWERGKKLWLAALQKGKKLALIAGNDAHGDFNRYRAIKSPFISILENQERFMGYGKTGVYSHALSEQSITDCIKAGKTFITTGPYANICDASDPMVSLISLEKLAASKKNLLLIVKSTTEFGCITQLSLFAYYENENSESLLIKRQYSDNSFNISEFVTIPDGRLPGYIRLEASTCTTDNRIFKAFTSACYY
jgi:predicted metal-dependent phosphoesterase TrpH